MEGDAPRIFALLCPRSDGSFGDGDDAGEGFASKAEAIDVCEVIVGEFGSGVTFGGKRYGLRFYAVSVVGDGDEFCSPILDVDNDL